MLCAIYEGKCNTRLNSNLIRNLQQNVKQKKRIFKIDVTAYAAITLPLSAVCESQTPERERIR